MKSIVFSLAVLAGFLGITAASPSSAQAQYPRYNSGYRVNNYGFYNSWAAPQYHSYANGTGFGYGVFNPGASRTTFTPNSLQRIWASQSYAAYSYNPWWGYRLNIATPAYWGFTANPYVGYRTFYQPGANISLPLGGGYGYVPPSYLLR